jgi:uncharacterized protein
MYIERTLEHFLGKATRQFPVILVMVPRQVGKNTILHHLKKKGRTYVTLDDPPWQKKRPCCFFNGSHHQS